MAMSLAACGGKTETPAETPDASSDAQTPSTDPITISLCNAYSDLDQLNTELKDAADRISERTNGVVTVNV